MLQAYLHSDHFGCWYHCVPTIVPFGIGYFTILITIIEGLRKEGEARLEKTLDSLHLHLTYASAMINNSAHALREISLLLTSSGFLSLPPLFKTTTNAEWRSTHHET